MSRAWICNVNLSFRYLIIVALAFYSSQASADEEAELAMKLANPVASLISLPFQYNYSTNHGIDDKGSRHLVNVQPVIPFSVSDDFNIISRTILPVISADNIPAGNSPSGIGDVLASFFLSPKQPTKGGLIWGVGPALNLPTASDEFLGSEKWSAGPTFIGLKQSGPWTFGLLAGHVWSYAGESDRADVDNTFLQPFASYVTASKTTFSFDAESNYDREDTGWTVPINLHVSQMLRVGGQIVQVGIGPRYWAETPNGGPEDWGARATFILLFPK